MRYTRYNCSRHATVMDVDAAVRIERVVEIDTETGMVTKHAEPVRINANGELETETVRYRSIYPIFGGSLYPVLFHCYGLQP